MKNKLNINSLSLYPFRFKKIYVGFSGGADSTALLLLLKAAAENSAISSFKIQAVHFEHGIRGFESRENARWCEKFCSLYNIPFKMVSLDLPPDLSNLEAAARYKRLEFWFREAKKSDVAVALGHHADDKMENFFLRLMRGGNAGSLTSLRTERVLDGVVFIRPLLLYKRVEIEEFLKRTGVSEWQIDESNFDTNIKRNFIRHKILPLFREAFPNADKALEKSLYALQVDAEFVELCSNNKFAEIKNKKSVPVKWFASLHNALLVRVLRYWISDLMNSQFIPTSDFVCRFEYLLKKYSSSTNNNSALRKSIQLPDNFSLSFQNNSVSILKNIETVIMQVNFIAWDWLENKRIVFNNFEFNAEIVKNIKVHDIFNSDNYSVFFKLDQCPSQFIIRLRKPGDLMIPFAAHTPVTVKKILENAGVTGDEKKTIPIFLAGDDHVVWLPGVKRAEFANLPCSDQKGTLEDLKILKITAKRGGI